MCASISKVRHLALNVEPLERSLNTSPESLARSLIDHLCVRTILEHLCVRTILEPKVSHLIVRKFHPVAPRVTIFRLLLYTFRSSWSFLTSRSPHRQKDFIFGTEYRRPKDDPSSIVPFFIRKHIFKHMNKDNPKAMTKSPHERTLPPDISIIALSQHNCFISNS